MTVGQRVKHLRGNKTLKEFSEPLEVTPATISAIETGKLGLSSDLAIRIAKTYKVSTDWLLMGEEAHPLVSQESSEKYVTITKDELIELQRQVIKTKTDIIKELENEMQAKNIHKTLRSES